MDDVSIGKFDILPSHRQFRWLLPSASDDVVHGEDSGGGGAGGVGVLRTAGKIGVMAR